MIQVGSAAADITPQAGVHLAGSGMGNRRPARFVLDPLRAKATVFESIERRICLLALDLCTIGTEFTTRVRSEISNRFEIPPEALLVHGTQTHSAPSIGTMMLDPDFPFASTPETEYLLGTESPYAAFVTEKSIEAVSQAVAALEPATIGSASGVRAGLAFNRRGVSRNGTVCMPFPSSRKKYPLGHTHLCYLEGPDDPEVGVLCARTKDLRVVALLLHFTCHPVNVFANHHTYYAVSADWPGAWAENVAGFLNGSCLPTVLNGCCGNLNPWDPFDPEFELDHHRMGNALGIMTERIIPSISFDESAIVDCRTRCLEIPYREVPIERLREVERILSRHPEPKWKEDGSGDVDPDWFLAASTRSIEHCRRRNPLFQYEIQVFRIGDTALVGLPGEPFVEGQLAIKIASPAKQTYVAHMSSHYVGYIPTADAFSRGGHEAHPLCTYWSKLAPEALDLIVTTAAEIVKDMFI